MSLKNVDEILLKYRQEVISARFISTEARGRSLRDEVGCNCKPCAYFIARLRVLSVAVRTFDLENRHWPHKLQQTKSVLVVDCH